MLKMMFSTKNINNFSYEKKLFFRENSWVKNIKENIQEGKQKVENVKDDV